MKKTKQKGDTSFVPPFRGAHVRADAHVPTMGVRHPGGLSHPAKISPRPTFFRTLLHSLQKPYITHRNVPGGTFIKKSSHVSPPPPPSRRLMTFQYYSAAFVVRRDAKGKKNARNTETSQWFGIVEERLVSILHFWNIRHAGPPELWGKCREFHLDEVIQSRADV